MSIKTAVLAVVVGLAAAGAAQAQAVVNISVNTPARVGHAPHAPVKPNVGVHRPAHWPMARVSHVPPRHVAFEPPRPAHVNHAPPRAHHPLPPPRANQHAPSRVHVGQQLSRYQLSQARDMDWRRAGLRAPQKGQQWVQLNGMRLLINMGTDRVLRVG